MNAKSYRPFCVLLANRGTKRVTGRRLGKGAQTVSRGGNRVISTKDAVASVAAPKKGNLSRGMLAFFIVFLFVGSAFITMAAAEVTAPDVWTLESDYLPGEKVVIKGEGFLPGEVRLTITQDGVQYVDAFCPVKPDGTFVYDAFITPETIADPSLPFVVTAYQDTAHQATCEFYDNIRITYQGWNLGEKPEKESKWTWSTGDVKGYFENDCIPYKLEIERDLTDTTPYYVQLGIDWRETASPYAYGFDFLSVYDIDPPQPAFNTGSQSNSPFTMDILEGTITGVKFLGIQAGVGDPRDMQVWEFYVNFAPTVTKATVEWAAHLAVTNDIYYPDGTYIGSGWGASYWNGKTLHVNILSEGEGSRDVPTSADIITPPVMHLEKSCNPTAVYTGQTITFSIHFWNSGEAAAYFNSFIDAIDPVATINPGSFQFGYSKGSSGVSWSPTYMPTLTSDYGFTWDPTADNPFPGTGDVLNPKSVHGWLNFTATVEGIISGEYYNRVSLIYTDHHDNYYPRLDASCKFTILALHPDIHIVKTSNMDCAAYGFETKITFTVTVSNPSPDATMTITKVYDSRKGDITANFPLTLAPGASASWPYDVVVPNVAATPGTFELYNKVEVWAHDVQLHEAYDYAEKAVDILHPGIEVLKTANINCAAFGYEGEVIFTIDIWNPSQDTVMTLTSVVDTLSGGEILNKFNPITLNPGQHTTYTYHVPVTDIAPTPGLPEIRNWVVVYAKDRQNHAVQDTDCEFVDIYHPDIQLDKWATYPNSETPIECAGVGETILYHVRVTNPSPDTYMNFIVTDTLLVWNPAFSGRLAPFGMTDIDGNPLWYVERTYSYPILVTTADPLINTATVQAWDDQFHYVYDEQTNQYPTDTWTVDIYKPGIDVEKWVTYENSQTQIECAGVGETVVWHLWIKNTGDVTLSVTITDAMIPSWEKTIQLASGAVYTDSYSMLVTANTPDPFTNVVSVLAKDPQWFEGSIGHTAADSDTWTVDVLHPTIDVEKFAYDKGDKSIPDEVVGVMVGDYVTYEIEVANPCNPWLDTYMDFTVTDTMFGAIWGSSSVDMWGTLYSALAPGQSVVFTGDIAKDTAGGYGDGYVYLAILHYQTVQGDIPSVKNVVTVEAWDYQYHYVDDTAEKIVKVYDYASMFGWVFRDDNLDGTFQMFVEPGLPGDITDGSWLIEVYGNDIFGNPQYYPANSEEISGYYGDDLTSIMPSDANGYTVKVTWTNPAWAPTTPIIILNVVVGSGENNGPHNFGFVEEQEITGYKWRDDNMNGLKDGNEPFLAGWVIKLDGYESFSRDPPAPPLHIQMQTTTDVNGQFSFRVFPGSYTVYEQFPDGTWVCIFPGPSGAYNVVTITSPGSTVWCCKFGNVQKGSISGVKFQDTNLNMVWDNGELGLNGWNVYLDGVQVNGVEVHRQTTTINGGYWSFADVYPGTYKVSEEDRYGWHATTPMFYDRILFVSGTVVPPQKFGNVPTTTIWGIKFLDKDLDGVKDANEPALPGWTIKLQKLNGDVWTSVATSVTDAGGKYLFRDLFDQPGTYRVIEIQQTGWTTTSSLPFGVTVVGRPAQPTVLEKDIGNIRYASIVGYKFEEKLGPNGEWPDNIRQACEWGIGNWYITLEGYTVKGDYVFMEAWTINEGLMCNIGYYEFTGLLPGTYTVTEYAELGWTPSSLSWTRTFTIPATTGSVKITYSIGNVHEIDPTMFFVLHEGMNLWSSPLLAQVNMRASELAALIGPSCQKIKMYNTTTGTYNTFIPEFNVPYSSKDFRLRFGVSYYIAVSEFTSFTMSGDLTSGSTVNLVEGANFIGFNELKPMYVSEFLNLIQDSNVQKVKYLDENGVWHTYIPTFNLPGSSKDFVMTQGRGYIVFVDGPGTVVFPTG